MIQNMRRGMMEMRDGKITEKWSDRNKATWETTPEKLFTI